VPDYVARFWSKVKKGAPDDCWIWQASGARGYGLFWNGTRQTAAHRFAYESVKGPIPPGLVLDHLCRNPPCVNPAHLEAVTDRVNLLRGDTIPARHAAKTHCPQGHPYSGENLYVGPTGRRGCRICRPSVMTAVALWGLP